ncbi:sigma factor-like helix-turn-helix DNA-binding protein [Streptomyces sp. 900116325]
MKRPASPPHPNGAGDEARGSSACLLTSGDTYLAEDLVQETLGRMYVVWGRSSKFSNPAAYADRSCACLSGAPAAAFVGEPRGPKSASQRDASLWLMLLEALRKLPAKDRAVVVPRYWELSVAETAGVLNVSSAAVRTRSTRELARLRVQLGDNIEEFAAH